MGEIHEPALIADRRQRVRERHAPRDLLLDKETDHLTLALRLDLLARDDDEVAAAGELDGLQRPCECVVVGDGDRAQTLGLGVVEEVRHGNGAIVRPAGVHV